MKKVSEEVKKEIREYCRLHNTLTGVYRVLGEKYGVAWETVRRINEPKYDRLVHRMYMRRRLLKLFEQNKTGIKPTYHKIFLSRVNAFVKHIRPISYLSLNIRHSPNQLQPTSLKQDISIDLIKS